MKWTNWLEYLELIFYPLGVMMYGDVKIMCILLLYLVRLHWSNIYPVSRRNRLTQASDMTPDNLAGKSPVPLDNEINRTTEKRADWSWHFLPRFWDKSKLCFLAVLECMLVIRRAIFHKYKVLLNNSRSNGLISASKDVYVLKLLE